MKWTDTLRAVLPKLPATFTTKDVYQHEAEIAAAHPGNNNVRPKIRQTLQVLRDAGELHNPKPGTWIKTAKVPLSEAEEGVQYFPANV